MAAAALLGTESATTGAAFPPHWRVELQAEKSVVEPGDTLRVNVFLFGDQMIATNKTMLTVPLVFANSGGLIHSRPISTNTNTPPQDYFGHAETFAIRSPIVAGRIPNHYFWQQIGLASHETYSPWLELILAERADDQKPMIYITIPITAAARRGSHQMTYSFFYSNANGNGVASADLDFYVRSHGEIYREYYTFALTVLVGVFLWLLTTNPSSGIAFCGMSRRKWKIVGIVGSIVISVLLVHGLTR